MHFIKPYLTMTRIKLLLIVFLSFAYTISSSSQNIIKTAKPDTISFWTKKNKVSLDISQISFVHWNAGGNNSISGLVKGKFNRKYERKTMMWDNELIMRYGLNKQDGQELRKTDDQLQLNSTFGFRKDTISNWYYGSKFNFNTQFYNGYAYPNRDVAISKPFAPAYMFLGIGAEYSKKEENLKVYLSPLTQKTTLVLDQRLANSGAYGVDKAEYDVDGNLIRNGKKSKTEIGVLITNQWEKEIFKNINFEHRLSLYSDYLNNFGNIDVDWQMQLEMTVNEFVTANIGTALLYDDDIKAKEEINGEQVTLGPRIQLKQILGIGAVYTF